jgi:hypothetical protein
LLCELDGLGAVFSASFEALLRVAARTRRQSRRSASLRFAVRLAKTGASAQSVLSSWQARLDYLQVDMAHIGIEWERVLLRHPQPASPRRDLLGRLDRSISRACPRGGDAGIDIDHPRPQQLER